LAIHTDIGGISALEGITFLTGGLIRSLITLNTCTSLSAIDWVNTCFKAAVVAVSAGAFGACFAARLFIAPSGYTSFIAVISGALSAYFTAIGFVSASGEASFVACVAPNGRACFGAGFLIAAALCACFKARIGCFYGSGECVVVSFAGGNIVCAGTTRKYQSQGSDGYPQATTNGGLNDWVQHEGPLVFGAWYGSMSCDEIITTMN